AKPELRGLVVYCSGCRTRFQTRWSGDSRQKFPWRRYLRALVTCSAFLFWLACIWAVLMGPSALIELLRRWLYNRIRAVQSDELHSPSLCPISTDPVASFRIDRRASSRR